MTIRRLAAAVLMLAPAGVAFAQEQHAHVHGLAHLDVAIEAGVVDMQLRATAYDLVGFERKPGSPEEEAKVLAARKAVLDHAALWQFNALARCVAEGPVLEVPGTGGHDHDHEHEHDHSHDHAHAHDNDHDHDHGGHSDWTVRYRFQCAAPEALKAIDSGLFTAFPSLQTVQVQLVDAAGAREATLTPAAVRLELAP